jgi:hypothetical protein
VLDANDSGVDMLLDLVFQLLYIPLSLEWVAATAEEDDHFVVAILIAVHFTWPVIAVIHDKSQVLSCWYLLSFDGGEKGITRVYVYL